MHAIDRRNLLIGAMGTGGLFATNNYAAADVVSFLARTSPSISSFLPPSALSVTIPAAVIDAVKAAPNKAIFNVSPQEVYTDNILKCDEIVFSPKGSLTLANWDARKNPFLVICAKRWKFLAPQERALIQGSRDFVGSTGKTGATGGAGPNGPSDDTAGGQGAQGAPGSVGETIQYPTLYLLGEKTVDQPGNPIPWMNLVIIATGSFGGIGGIGGDGGTGGNGASGHPGSDSLVDCKRGPGDGGQGGPGGPGGQGGQGGNGGNGGDLVYAGPQSFLDIITFANLINIGGGGGIGGRGGRGGSGGSGGPRGSNTFYCHGGRPGGDGPSGIQGQAGPNGVDGGKGSADVSIRTSLADLY